MAAWNIQERTANASENRMPTEATSHIMDSSITRKVTVEMTAMNG